MTADKLEKIFCITHTNRPKGSLVLFGSSFQGSFVFLHIFVQLRLQSATAHVHVESEQGVKAQNQVNTGDLCLSALSLSDKRQVDQLEGTPSGRGDLDRFMEAIRADYASTKCCTKTKSKW